MNMIGSHILETKHGAFNLFGFQHAKPPEIIVALKRNHRKSGKPWLVRIQYGCLSGTAFHSVDCDCARQLDYSLRRVARSGRGVVLYFPKREANGAGLAAKIRMLARRGETESSMQEMATGMVEAATEVRKLRIVRSILGKLKVNGPIDLLTNSPRKVAAIEKAGIAISSVVHFKVPEHNLSAFGKRELRTKRKVLGHWSP
ncbi:MAG: hypothetical protein NTX50_15865 [Candidatus Sumerlaeota bacterium]|nr:hypothetical protein [Candidatus Sumerlaeota bacterium]